MLLENIQVVVICVNYSDFLRITYQQNIRFFNRNNYYIITSKDDQETVDLCIELNNRYETYDDFYINSSKLNKSGAINKIQKRLHNDFPNDWILLLDADIILPNNFDELFLSRCINNKCLYSFKRKDYEEQNDFLNSKNLVDYTGINFMGFMQLYHNKTKFYPEFSNDCGICDAIFRDYFFDYLVLIDDDSYVVHLGKKDINNRGRITEYWL